MENLCPISSQQVNERLVQFNAALSLISLLFIFTPFKWVVGILALDLFIRGFLNPSYSLYSALGRALLQRFGIQPVMVNAGPKIFAAKIGFAFSCLIGLFSWLDLPGPRLAVCLIFMTCAALEAVFRFCLACRIYPYIYARHHAKGTKPNP